MKPNKTITIISILILLFTILFLPSTSSSEPDKSTSTETRYTTIKGTASDLDNFRNGLDPWYPFRSIDNVSDTVDGIFKRVQNILGMNNKKMKSKITIKLFSNNKKLYTEYLKLKDTAFRNFDKYTKLRAWYIQKTNTVYINVKDVHSGMLAHEMAHAVIDNYLLIRPPDKTAEILAMWVELKF